MSDKDTFAVDEEMTVVFLDCVPDEFKVLAIPSKWLPVLREAGFLREIEPGESITFTGATMAM